MKYILLMFVLVSCIHKHDDLECQKIYDEVEDAYLHDCYNVRSICKQQALRLADAAYMKCVNK